jgi:hypothetical protein
MRAVRAVRAVGTVACRNNAAIRRVGQDRIRFRLKINGLTVSTALFGFAAQQEVHR